VPLAFEARTSETQILRQAASILRHRIKEAQSSSPETPWPPSTEFLSADAISPPPALTDFLSLVISGKLSDESSAKCQRLTASIAEDVCSAATHGSWMMPKHILLGVTLRYLTGRADLVTLLNSSVKLMLRRHFAYEWWWAWPYPSPSPSPSPICNPSPSPSPSVCGVGHWAWSP